MADKEYASIICEAVRVLIADGTDTDAMTVGDVRRGILYPQDLVIVRKQIAYDDLKALLLTDTRITTLYQDATQDNEEYRVGISYRWYDGEYPILIIVADDTGTNYDILTWWYTGSTRELLRLQRLALVEGYYSLDLEGLKSDESTVDETTEDGIYTALGESTKAPGSR